MNLRHLQDTDIASLLSLWNRSVRFDQLTPGLLEEKVFDDPDYDRELALVIDDGQHLAGFIMGVVRVRNGENRGYVKLLVVDPKRQRRGLGSRLLQELEARLGQGGCVTIRLFEANPNYLVPGLDPRYSEAVAFFEKHGYQRFGETANMEVDLAAQDFETAADEVSLRGEGIEIRRAIMGDYDEIMGFLQRHWSAWIPEVQRELLNYPVSLHLALRQDRVVGFAGFDGNNLNTGWFGPMGTEPSLRGKGIGGVLLRRCLGDLKSQGRRLAIIPWIGPYVFYSHYSGARITRIFWRYKKDIGKQSTTS